MTDFGMQTTIGTRHQVNEDSLGHAGESALWLVADGMGGHAAGDVASAIVRDRICEAVAGGSDLPAAISAAHLAVAASAAAEAGRKGMGSTVVALRMIGSSAEIAWVGDSRAYLLRSGKLSRLTHDHTLVQWLLDKGDISAEEAAVYPGKNVLVRTLGLEHPVVDETSVRLKRGDLLLLCSDGVTAELPEDEIRTVLLDADSTQSAVDTLIRAVVERRGKDDASAIVIRIDAQEKLSAGSWLPVVAGVGIGLGAYLIWTWMKAS
ncbi:MAG: PP2C family protein-serine/threonine phosphatase [Pseudomonadales bacterium]